MKWMTFNSSCAYAGLANMLERWGVDTEDRSIALAMELPLLFAYEDGAYCAGPMLQTAQWFALYLRPLGFEMKETRIPRAQTAAYLNGLEQAMLGLAVTPESKHAVIYTGKEGERYRFLNNKWKESSEPDTLLLTEEELLSRLPEQVVAATLERTAPGPVDMAPYLRDSLAVLGRMKHDLWAFCEQEQTRTALRASRDALFRALLLDGLSMAALLGEAALEQSLGQLQGELLSSLRENQPVRLADRLSMDVLEAALNAYAALIKARLMTLSERNVADEA